MASIVTKICQKYETEDSPFLIIINQNREDVVKYILDNLGKKTIYDQKKYDPYIFQVLQKSFLTARRAPRQRYPKWAC